MCEWLLLGTLRLGTIGHTGHIGLNQPMRNNYRFQKFKNCLIFVLLWLMLRILFLLNFQILMECCCALCDHGLPNL